MVRLNPHRLLPAITLVIVGAAGGWVPLAAAQDLIFADGFESGDLTAWESPVVVPTVRPAEATVSVDEGAGTLELLVEVDDPNGQEIRVDWMAVDGTAAEGSDFTSVGGTLVISGGLTSGTIEVQIIDDLLVETDETFAVSLSNP